jgi:heterodisulfide reductase subunit A-like polyferredoxin
VADPITLETSIRGVFAGGDVFYGPRSVVEAVECGKEACESIDRYLKGEDLKEGREKERSYEKPDIALEPLIPRTPMRMLSPKDRKGNFHEIAKGYSEKEAVTEAERCLKCGICSECYQCVKACLADAINHEDKEVERVVEVGSVILCPGATTFDPTPLEDSYHYKKHPNVVTSIEFERILSASGPYLGHVVRPSDEKEPKKIAWLQCVGSRDEGKVGNGYCSYMCCMYAIKEAVIAKEHSKEALDTAIFFMDMRTFGKDYEKYYTRARDEHGVRFIMCRVHTIDPVPGSDDLIIRYIDDRGNLREEVFDMLVLSVGIKPGRDVVAMAERLGVELNEDKFAITQPFTPVHTTREGVFACGTFQSPKDIPNSVTDGSAAACAAAEISAISRGTETRNLEIPEEKDVEGLEPRIGVFVCNCGINISGVVDVPGATEYAATLPSVVFSDHNLFTCSQDTQEAIKEKIIEHELNRIVVASCSPRTHEPLFMETLQACGLNKYLFEMANIRDQDSWVHGSNPVFATEKAKDLVRMAVARAGLLKPLKESKIKVNKRALVIGGGIAGMNAALGLAKQGFEAVIVEKEARLGGLANNVTVTIEGDDIQTYLASLIEEVTDNKKIRQHLINYICGNIF